MTMTIAQIMAKKSIHYRLNPNSYGFNPNYDFKAEADDMFNHESDINEYLQAIKKYSRIYANDMQEEFFKRFIDNSLDEKELPAAIYAVDRITGQYDYMMEL